MVSTMICLDSGAEEYLSLLTPFIALTMLAASIMPASRVPSFSQMVRAFSVGGTLRTQARVLSASSLLKK